MFSKGQIGREVFYLQQMMGGCKRSAKVDCFGLSQSPDYLVAGSRSGEIGQWFGHIVQQ
jgi:hypothetical protein